MSKDKSGNPLDQWKTLAGNGEGKSRWVEPIEAMRALDAMALLQGKPGVLILDDLTGFASGATRTLWNEKIDNLRRFFDVSCPVLPIHGRHAEKDKNADDLLPIIKAEIQRLRRPLAAIVDMQWEFCDGKRKSDGQEKEAWFGLELIRLIKRAKPSLPIFVWSPIQDKHVLQRAMQLGASSCFDKPEGLRFNHDLPTEWKPDNSNLLDAGKLWFRLLEWELARYQCPPVGSGEGDFILSETPETLACKKRFIRDFGLTACDLRSSPEPAVERLLRALVPGAVGVEILRFFGEGQSGLERPFVVRGKTANHRWLRPVQIKLSRNWRALSREGKGYRDVFAACLGPSVAHVLMGPYRLGDWCGMAQSFAAPEEAIRDISSKSTRSLESWLRKKLPLPGECQDLVDEIFDGVLDPLYKGNLTKRAESVIKAFDRVTPPHLELPFVAVETGKAMPSIDLNPNALSRKNARARREQAYRAWKKVEDWWNEPGDGHFTIHGMVVESLEIDAENPVKSRLRLLDPTLGIKVDLSSGKLKKDQFPSLPSLWSSLEKSPIKLVGLPVSYAIEKSNGTQSEGAEREDSGAQSRKYLLNGWTNSVENLLEGNGILQLDLNREAWNKVKRFLHPSHPVDWSEEFHIGPTHGDLNLGNILLHEKGGRLFPWLIDFDKAEDERPVVFDLAKLEIEAFHKIAQELFWELLQTGCIKDESEVRDLISRFDRALTTKGVTDISHLWEQFHKIRAVPESLKNRFSGLFAYLKQVHKRVDDLGVTAREFLIGRTIYSLSCLKFKHLYQADTHPNAPFPANVMLWKLEALIDALDADNGIITKEHAEKASSRPQQKAIRDIVLAVREAREQGVTKPLGAVLKPVFNGVLFNALSNMASHKGSKGWEALLRLLRDKQIPGRNRWIRELLWYARDFGVERSAEDLASFTKAVVLSSQDPGTSLPVFEDLWDYASTGRLGNIHPSEKMFEHLADPTKGKLIKISSRGDSGGTIDILEQAGIPICTSRAAVDHELAARGWAVVETGKHLCEVDKILMSIRKDCHCMKVSDLAMASISSKKVALGIQNFSVQVVTGYDAKFAELIDGKDCTVMITRWLARISHTRLLLPKKRWAVCCVGVSGADPGMERNWVASQAGFRTVFDFTSSLFLRSGCVVGMALRCALQWSGN